jgi:hypothetical protein
LFTRSEAMMIPKCQKCGGEMEEGRMSSQFMFGFKSNRQRHWSFEANVQKARVCLSCGYIEMFVDPQEVNARVERSANQGD